MTSNSHLKIAKATIQSAAPIVISGVGGSGTRVIAQILKEIGCYIGSDLNSALDNLWFTLLFKRPKWFLKNHIANSSQIFTAVTIFEKLMFGDKSLTQTEFLILLKAAVEWSIFGNHFGGIGSSGRGMWSFKRLHRMFLSNKLNQNSYNGWGWKEPNTHIYLQYLIDYFPDMKFIHVMRNGLDMAFSRNQTQLNNWGSYFGIDIKSAANALPQLSLEYWVLANEQTIRVGAQLAPQRFLLINYEKLCLNPKIEILRLLDFLTVDTKSININHLQNLPQIPASMGRYKKQNLNLFTEQQINAVRKLGFEVEYSRK